MMKEQQIGVPSNVAVFVDYENVHKALLAQNTNILHHAFFEKLRKWCSERERRVVRIVVYCNFDNNDKRILDIRGMCDKLGIHQRLPVLRQRLPVLRQDS